LRGGDSDGGHGDSMVTQHFVQFSTLRVKKHFVPFSTLRVKNGNGGGGASLEGCVSLTFWW
jgi:hypothetical protein